jgi:hypothetical protein
MKYLRLARLRRKAGSSADVSQGTANGRRNFQVTVNYVPGLLTASYPMGKIYLAAPFGRKRDIKLYNSQRY